MNMFDFFDDYLNKVSLDPFIYSGSGADTDYRSGVGNFDLGFLGKKAEYDAAEIVKMTVTDATAGIVCTAETVPMKIQWVRAKSSLTGTITRGRLLFWDDLTNFIVTPDATAASNTTTSIAGFALRTHTAGKVFPIVIGGIAPVLFGTVTKGGTQAVGDGVIWKVASSLGVGDVLADATALTSLTGPKVLGRAYGTAPADATVSYVQLTRELGCPYRNAA